MLPVKGCVFYAAGKRQCFNALIIYLSVCKSQEKNTSLCKFFDDFVVNFIKAFLR